MINKKFQNFLAILGHPEGRGRATPIVWQSFNFSIFLNSCSIDQLKFPELFSAMMCHLEGRNKTTPIFWQKSKLVILHGVAYDLE